MDATDLPPSAFSLPDDASNRKKQHLWNRRKALAQVLARRADPNGSNTRQSVSTMMKMTGMERRTVFNVLAELRELGFLKDGELHATGTRIRMLTLPTPMQDSGTQNEGPVQDSGTPMQDSQAPVQDRQGTHAGLNAHTTALDLPPTDAHTHRGSASENQNTFAQVAKYLELDMLTSQWKHGEMDKAEALIREHGWKKFYAAQRLYWEAQDPEQFSKTLFRWTGLLNSFAGLLQKVTPELLAHQDMDRFRKEHPEEWERIQQESMDRQTEELVRIKFTNNTPKEPIAECALEDIFGKD
jgi:hypothetical protein